MEAVVSAGIVVALAAAAAVKGHVTLTVVGLAAQLAAWSALGFERADVALSWTGLAVLAGIVAFLAVAAAAVRMARPDSPWARRFYDDYDRALARIRYGG